MESETLGISGGKKMEEEEAINYANLLKEFMEPFESKFSEKYCMEDLVNFTIHAWNIANMSLLMPEEEYKKMLKAKPPSIDDLALFKKMINHKKLKFGQHDSFIVDYELGSTQNNRTELTVDIVDKDEFLDRLSLEILEHEFIEGNKHEGFINRCSITLKPKKPFFDWINKFDPNDPFMEVEEYSVYLINDENDDIEQWLKKKFDKLFMAELDGWHENKKEWPQKRSYKMLKEWFHVEVSSMIYDFEREPILK